MGFKTTSEPRSVRRPSIFAFPARRWAAAIAVLLLCGGAAAATLFFLNTPDQRSGAGAVDSKGYVSNEPAWRREKRYRRLLNSEARAPQAVVYHPGFRDSRAGPTPRTEPMAVRNIHDLRAALEQTELDIDRIYRETAVKLSESAAPSPAAVAGFRPALPANAAAEARLFALFADLERFTILSYAASMMPLGVPINATRSRFSSGFGMRTHPITGEETLHAGADFAAPEGAAVSATAAGVVVFAGERGGYGQTVQIRHEFGLETTYAHLHHIRVEEGDRVEFDMWIGDMGSTGHSTGNHLHYEVRLDGAPLDPIKFIRAGRDVYQK